MKFYRHWAWAELPATDKNGKQLVLRKWAGSNSSLAEAKAAAEKAVRAVKDRLGTLRAQDEYAYGTRDIPEELIREISANNVITRNRLGCLVLNTTEACFADVDIPEPGFFARLTGASREKSERQAIALLKKLLEADSRLGVRIYRTKAGLRYLFTHAPLAVNDETLGWLAAIGSDKLYTKLCREQKCFRARLTPKPWRIRARPANRYPRETPETQAAFRKWLDNYNSRSEPYAVCKFIEAAGSGSVHSSIGSIVREHDAATRADADLPLA